MGVGVDEAGEDDGIAGVLDDGVGEFFLQIVCWADGFDAAGGEDYASVTNRRASHWSEPGRSQQSSRGRIQKSFSHRFKSDAHG